MSALRWGAATHEGLVRTENEDSFVAEPMVFAVADGMGGHQAGEVASELAVRTLRERLAAGVTELDVVIASVVEANAAIFQAAHHNAGQQGMGTTLTAIAVLAATDEHPQTLALVNVGDSRTYRVRGGKLERVTIDHSYVQELVATGHISEMEARTHPRRNIVTRALGIEPTVRVDSWVLSMVRGDRFVLCSDGLVDEVPDHEIELVAAGVADPQATADELVAMANRHGGRDNVTVLVVDVLEGIDVPEEAATAAADVPAGGREVTGVVPRLPPPDGSPGVGAGPVLTDTVPLAGTATATPQAAATTVLPTVADAPATGRPKRRITTGMFLFLLALAVIITVTVTLVLVSVNNDDSPSTPSTPSDTSDTTATSEGTGTMPDTLPPTTLPPATLPPTTVATAATSTPAPTTSLAGP